MRPFLMMRPALTRQVRRRIAQESLQRLKARVRELMRQGRGRSLTHTIEALNPVLRGWIGHFQLTQCKRAIEELDGWLRRHLRCLLWRQAKTRQRRTGMLRHRGLTELRAWTSGHNGQGPWWNAGASHMNAAFPKSFFDGVGLISLINSHRRLQCHS